MRTLPDIYVQRTGIFFDESVTNSVFYRLLLLQTFPLHNVNIYSNKTWNMDTLHCMEKSLVNKLIHCLKKTQCVLCLSTGIHFQRSKFNYNTPMTSWRSIFLPRGRCWGRGYYPGVGVRHTGYSGLHFCPTVVMEQVKLRGPPCNWNTWGNLLPSVWVIITPSYYGNKREAPFS